MTKKVFYFSMLLFAALALTSCDKDEPVPDPEPDPKPTPAPIPKPEPNLESIVGIWEYYDLKIIDFTIDNKAVASATIKELEKILKEDGNPLYGVLEFTSNGKVFADNDKDDYTRYKINGNKITISSDEDEMSVDYSINGNQLQLNLDMLLFDEYDELAEVGVTTFILGLIFTRQGTTAENSYTITDGSNKQVFNLEPTQQLHILNATTGNGFLINFSGTFSVGFGSSDLTATMLPSGTYPISTLAFATNAAASSIKIPGVSEISHATSGSFIVQKSGSNYNITFSFTTDTNPVRTVTGSYNGTIPSGI